MVAKFVGAEVSQVLTCLDLSANNLTLLVGLEGLTNLKKLNLNHNKLTTISSLNKLPSLIEFRLSWNCLRFFQSTAAILHQATPRLLTLEILPNPFQVIIKYFLQGFSAIPVFHVILLFLKDIRDPSHIPKILRRLFTVIHRIDVWTSPFPTPAPLFCKKLFGVADTGFSHVAMAKSWGIFEICSFNRLQNVFQMSR